MSDEIKVEVQVKIGMLEQIYVKWLYFLYLNVLLE